MAPCHSCFERKTITVLYKNPITKETVEKEMVTNDYLCLLCKNTIDPDKSVITIVKGGNTTNLWKHLREKHIQTHDKLKGKGDQDPAPLSSPSSKVSSTTKDAGQLGKDDVLEQTTSRRGPPVSNLKLKFNNANVLPIKTSNHCARLFCVKIFITCRIIKSIIIFTAS